MVAPIDFNPVAQGFNVTYGSSVETEPRINRVEFGDGYVQRTGDGLNTQPRKINAQFINLSAVERDYLITMLKERGGYKPIRWAMGRQGSALYIAQKWSEVQITANAFEISVQCAEVFDLT